MSNGTITTNRKARYEYFVEDALEAGIELKGAEVKSLRDYKVSIAEAYAAIEGGQIWLHGMHIAPYQPAADQNLDPNRRRKLLLRGSQIRRLQRQIQQKGYTLIPLKLYFSKRGYAKVELGVCRGKRQYDKREAIKEREFQRRADRAVSEHRRRQ